MTCTRTELVVLGTTGHSGTSKHYMVPIPAPKDRACTVNEQRGFYYYCEKTQRYAAAYRAYIYRVSSRTLDTGDTAAWSVLEIVTTSMRVTWRAATIDQSTTLIVCQRLKGSSSSPIRAYVCDLRHHDESAVGTRVEVCTHYSMLGFVVDLLYLLSICGLPLSPAYPY